LKVLHYVTWVLLVVGGHNWGLVALKFNLVDKIFGAGSTLSMVVYALVGLSALYELFTHWGRCKVCSKSDGMSKPMGM